MSKRRTKQRYEVTGSVPYGEHAPGETFEATLDEDAERRALARGSIKLVGKPAKEEGDE